MVEVFPMYVCHFKLFFYKLMMVFLKVFWDEKEI